MQTTYIKQRENEEVPGAGGVEYCVTGGFFFRCHKLIRCVQLHAKKCIKTTILHAQNHAAHMKILYMHAQLPGSNVLIDVSLTVTLGV